MGMGINTCNKDTKSQWMTKWDIVVVAAVEEEEVMEEEGVEAVDVEGEAIQAVESTTTTITMGRINSGLQKVLRMALPRIKMIMVMIKEGGSCLSIMMDSNSLRCLHSDALFTW